MPAVKDGEPVAPFLLRVAPPGRAERRRRVAAHRPAQLLRPPGARSDADADAEPGFEPEPELPTLRRARPRRLASSGPPARGEGPPLLLLVLPMGPVPDGGALVWRRGLLLLLLLVVVGGLAVLRRQQLVHVPPQRLLRCSLAAQPHDALRVEHTTPVRRTQ